MERKIGEIFEYNGEWYQCVKSANCNECAFLNNNCAYNPNFKCSADDRKDNCSVIFKKLEKVGEPYRRWLSPFNNIMVQRYRLYGRNVIMPDEPIMLLEPNYKNSVEIEIKQIKEDMEEKKLNLKPFDIQKAREGKPVCTRDGKKARIICFDRKFYHDGYNYPIVAMVNDNDNELVHAYTQDGLLVGNMERELDLMMLPEKKEGWVNIYRSQIYNTLEKAKEAYKRTYNDNNYFKTIKIEWEE